MKIRTLTLALLLVSAPLAFAGQGTPAVLTNEGAIYTVGELPAAQLELVRRVGETRETVLVPSTDDAMTETEAQLAYDSRTSTLFVVWHAGDSIYLSRLTGDGTWSEPQWISAVEGRKAGLELAITRVATTTLLHAVWWNLGADPIAEYALVAFENNEAVSTYNATLTELAGITNDATDYSADNDIASEVVHPPLAMARVGTESVEIIFGRSKSTRLHRVVLEPKIRGDVRIWKPGRRGGKELPPARLNSVSGDPVQAILNQGRVILYTPETRFRFVIFEKGEWSPERMIQLDERLTQEQLIQQLHKTIESLKIDETPDEPADESE